MIYNAFDEQIKFIFSNPIENKLFIINSYFNMLIFNIDSYNYDKIKIEYSLETLVNMNDLNEKDINIKTLEYEIKQNIENHENKIK